jgi:hypothetical protein
VKSTGPILAIGAITLANMTILHNQPLDMRVPLATAAAVGVFALGEKLYAPAAVGIAWLALVTTLFVPVDGRTPAPMQSAQDWWNTTGSGTTTPKSPVFRVV